MGRYVAPPHGSAVPEDVTAAGTPGSPAGGVLEPAAPAESAEPADGPAVDAAS